MNDAIKILSGPNDANKRVGINIETDPETSDALIVNSNIGIGMNPTVQFPGFRFYPAVNSALVGRAASLNYSGSHFQFNEYSIDTSTGLVGSHRELYQLPNVADDLTEDKTYEIWTSKGNTDSLGTTSNYVKLQNGIMIQWGENTKTGVTTSAQGGIYASNAAQSISFPQEFANTYYNVQGVSRYSTGYIMPIGFSPSNTSYFSFYIYDTVARSNVTYTVRWQAIGHWK